MKQLSLHNQAKQIENLISSVSGFPDDNLELRSHWAKYICVLTAGFLENCLQETFISYVSDKANPQVASYSAKNLLRISNPKPHKFVETAGYFNESWKQEIELILKDEKYGEAINALMTNRHQIAHGKNSAITLSRVKEYFHNVKTFAEKFELVILNP